MYIKYVTIQNKIKNYKTKWKKIYIKKKQECRINIDATSQ